MHSRHLTHPSRRAAIQRLMWPGLAALGTPLAQAQVASGGGAPVQPMPGVAHKPIHSSGELLPVVGLGSCITCNVGDDTVARAACT